ncbi:MAG: pyruvate, phosphate dikinase [Candidatus Cloacimonetes bacterium]|nr:pyruvate, phosphate dikinase [Candidatus Cloacimonadota bacterium]
MDEKKRVYLFGNGKADGKANMKELLGGKGANLAEMNLIGLPVPPGFTITTEACNEYYDLGRDEVKKLLEQDVKKAVTQVEEVMSSGFGDKNNPLLLSVRSGARASMPGMMDTVLNLGLNDEVVEGLSKIAGNERFAWDSYRRFIQMFGDVVMGLKPEKKEDTDPFEEIIDHLKEEKKIDNDIDLTIDDLKLLVDRFKKIIKEKTGKEFPIDPWQQLWESVMAVFDSWNTPRAVYYRKMHGYPADWGTAVNVQAMVFGNMGDNSATGVAFTRDAATGEKLFNGEYLINAQGEDVVAGIRTPQEITKEGSQRWAKLQNISEEERVSKYPSLEETMPEVYKELYQIQQKLENHYKDMQDLEFTIQDGKLWILQTRNGKRTGPAMVKIAVDMLKEGLINEKTALLRNDPSKLDELLHPIFTQEALDKAKVISKGLPASPGAASGQIVFFAEEAEEWAQGGKDVILVRKETSPEDLRGMNVAKGILTSRGGMTSHAAVVARGMGKCCVSGAGTVTIDYRAKTLKAGDTELKEGDWISLNGTTGEVYEGKLETKLPDVSGDFETLMKLCDRFTTMAVRTNADTPKDSGIARKFGAKGIGLCRTEHMFFEGDRIKAVREMILAHDEEGRRKALEKLLPMQKEDFEGIFTAMDNLPVTIRLLDPPLHEFVPHDEKSQEEMAKELGVSAKEVKAKVESLNEMNPMLGHRGCRLGITYPEITEMQARAIFEAALNLKKKSIKAVPEIMIPLIGTVEEFVLQEKLIRKVADELFAERNDSIEYLVGTMIEIPRATIVADKIAEHAEFFSFGTNDLTQMTFGYSRDDAGKFLPVYLENNILKKDPFQVIDQEGVGMLIKLGIDKGRSTNKELKIGICGEHGGEPESVKFCHKVGMNYVSCSPYRVPIARLAAAQAAIE